MNEISYILSCVPVVVAVGSYVLLRRIGSSPLAIASTGIFFLVALVSIWLVDLEFPWQPAVIRSTGNIAPAWLAAAIWSLKAAFFAALAASARLKRTASNI
jgi:hypothetical protein